MLKVILIVFIHVINGHCQAFKGTEGRPVILYRDAQNRYIFPNSGVVGRTEVDQPTGQVFEENRRIGYSRNNQYQPGETDFSVYEQLQKQQSQLAEKIPVGPGNVQRDYRQYLDNNHQSNNEGYRPVIEQYLKEVTPTTRISQATTNPSNYLRFSAEDATVNQEPSGDYSKDVGHRQSPFNVLQSPATQQKLTHPQTFRYDNYDQVNAAPQAATQSGIAEPSNFDVYQNVVPHRPLSRGTTDPSRSSIYVSQKIAKDLNQRKQPQSKPPKTIQPTYEDIAQNVNFYTYLQQLQEQQPQSQQSPGLNEFDAMKVPTYQHKGQPRNNESPFQTVQASYQISAGKSVADENKPSRQFNQRLIKPKPQNVQLTKYPDDDQSTYQNIGEPRYEYFGYKPPPKNEESVIVQPLYVRKLQIEPEQKLLKYQPQGIPQNHPSILTPREKYLKYQQAKQHVSRVPSPERQQPNIERQNIDYSHYYQVVPGGETSFQGMDEKKFPANIPKYATGQYEEETQQFPQFQPSENQLHRFQAAGSGGAEFTPITESPDLKYHKHFRRPASYADYQQ